jgi:hypothetical protein
MSVEKIEKEKIDTEEKKKKLSSPTHCMGDLDFLRNLNFCESSDTSMNKGTKMTTEEEISRFDGDFDESLVSKTIDITCKPE